MKRSRLVRDLDGMWRGACLGIVTPLFFIGYFNYLDFIYCVASDIRVKTQTSDVSRAFTCIMLAIWMLFLLHIIETTTNDYFVTSLQVRHLSASTPTARS